MIKTERKIIANVDGGVDLGDPSKHETAESLVQRVVGHFPGTNVTTVFYCTNVWGTSFTHNTQAGEFAGETLPGYIDAKRIIEREGKDNLRIVSEWCKAHGLEFFWSLRINDIHDAMLKRDDMNYPRTKREHPDWLVGDGVWHEERDILKPEYWHATALDYKRREVRDFQFNVIREVCDRYDIDGVELDFCRSPVMFKAHKAIENTPVMTEWIQRVRDHIQPRQLAIRVPSPKMKCKAIGLDVDRLVTNRIVDLLVAGSGYNPFQMSIGEFMSADVPVYPCIETHLWKWQCIREDTARYDGVLRAAAERWYTQGAAGMYCFNAQTQIKDGESGTGYGPPLARFTDVGSLDDLHHKDKLRMVSLGEPRRHRQFCWHDVPDVGGGCEPYIMPVEVKKSAEFELSVFSLSSLERRLVVKFYSLSLTDGPSIFLNGNSTEAGVRYGKGDVHRSVDRVEWVNPSPLKVGMNTVRIETTKPVMVENIELWERW